MFEQILSCRLYIERHRNGPYAAERERYLAFLLTEGRSRSILRAVTALLYSMAECLPLGNDGSISSSQIETAAEQWSATRRGGKKHQHNAERWFVFHATNWMRLLGRLKEEGPPSQAFASELEAFITFEEQERGFAPATVMRVKRCLSEFLNWIAGERKALRKIVPEDIARYVSRVSVERNWKRTTIVAVVSAFRTLLRFAGSRHWCTPDLVNTIDAPRIYKLEGLVQGPRWDDVQILLTGSSGDSPGDIRDHAMLLLIAVYGLRSGEVRHLRLDDIDWEREVIVVRRTKQRSIQRYPLVPVVGNAILRYLREVRPRCPHREVFLTQVQPFRPITSGGFGAKVRKRFLKSGLVPPCYGPHGLRHSCATHLLAEGFSMKEIADHLGHVSLAATQMYAKVDITALREVAQLDLSNLTAYAEHSAHSATPIYVRGSMEALHAVAAISLGGLL
jgi:site-specific recombinase XerD